LIEGGVNIANNTKNILLAGVFSDEILPIFKDSKDRVYHKFGNEKIDFDNIDMDKLDFAIFFGFKYKIPLALLGKKTKFVNLHGSFLPYGRGVHPDIWTWIDSEPQGVSIHEMSGEYDEGDILFQKEIELDPNMVSINSTLDTLVVELSDLFKEKWIFIKNNKYSVIKQPPIGKKNRLKKHTKDIKHIVDEFCDKPVSEFLESYMEYERKKY